MNIHVPRFEDHYTKYLDTLREYIVFIKTSTITQRIQEFQNLIFLFLATWVHSNVGAPQPGTALAQIKVKQTKNGYNKQHREMWVIFKSLQAFAIMIFPALLSLLQLMEFLSSPQGLKWLWVRKDQKVLMFLP